MTMQKIDLTDQRPAYIQIAASIRAAILSGELEPGHPIPRGEDLAAFFEVNRTTVVQAIRELRHEGFVKDGGGRVQVETQAALPAGDDEHPLTPVANYIYEQGFLKRMPRTGWVMLGVAGPETVGEHSYRTATVGIALAAMEGADIGQVAALCVLHDSAETRLSDIAVVSRAYLDAARPEAVVTHQTNGMPEAAAAAYRELVSEFEAGETLEARCARDADKLELLATSKEYEHNGYDTAEWQQTSLEALRTKSGQLIGQAIMTTDPKEWRQAFARSYHEIKASAKARRK